MKIGVTLNDDAGMESQVCGHFGQCSHFLIVEAEGGQVKSSKVVPNNAPHGGGGCQAVGEIMQYGVTHVVAGGMGGGAVMIFEERGVQVVAGASGDARSAVERFLKGELKSTGEICHEHAMGEHGENC